MTETLEQEQPQAAETLTGLKRGRRAGKRKTGFRMDTPPFPVRFLWEAASPEDRQRAHQTGVLMLEHWLGRMTRRELGEKIGLPPLRVWQMSQQALAGMVAGLLKQPKNPPRGTPLPSEEEPGENAMDLKRENEKLRRENELLTELVAVLRDMPGNKKVDLDQIKSRNQKKISPNPLATSARNLAAQPKNAQG
jgi:hypothetical protein